MLRRGVLKLGGGLAAAALQFKVDQLGAAPSKLAQEKIVVIGGGFAGSRVASRLKTMVPELEITLVDRNSDFVIGPLVLDYVFGRRELDQITIDYDDLRDHGFKIVRSEILGVDIAKSIIVTSGGNLPFTRLVLATGCGLSFEDLDGFTEASLHNLCAYDRARIGDLRQRIATLGDETVIVGIPDTRLVCPPAPYEFVLLLAETIRRRHLKARIVVLDSNVAPQPQPLADLFQSELTRHADTIEYVHTVGAIKSIDASKRSVTTKFGDEFEYSWLSLFPRGTIANFIKDLNVTEGPGATFVQVGPLNMKTAKYDNVFAVGDVAQTPYGRSASAAVTGADLCAQAIAADLGIAAPIEAHTVNVACYPYIDEASTLSLKVQYDVVASLPRPQVKSAAQVRRADAENLDERRRWLSATVFGAFGKHVH